MHGLTPHIASRTCTGELGMEQCCATSGLGSLLLPRVLWPRRAVGAGYRIPTQATTLPCCWPFRNVLIMQSVQNHAQTRRFVGEWYVHEEGRGSPTHEQISTASRNCFITGGIYIAFTVLVSRGSALQAARSGGGIPRNSGAQNQPTERGGVLASTYGRLVMC